MPATIFDFRPAWHRRAACGATTEPDLFSMIDDQFAIEEARAVCRICPLDVRLACFAEAVRINDRHTIRAGLTPWQRRTFPAWMLRKMAANPHLFSASRRQMTSGMTLADAA